MLSQIKQSAQNQYKSNDKKFNCRISQRVIFRKNDKFYEIKELNDHNFYCQTNNKIPFLKNENIQFIFDLKDLKDKFNLKYTHDNDDGYGSNYKFD